MSEQRRYDTGNLALVAHSLHGDTVSGTGGIFFNFSKKIACTTQAINTCVISAENGSKYGMGYQHMF